MKTAAIDAMNTAERTIVVKMLAAVALEAAVKELQEEEDRDREGATAARQR